MNADDFRRMALTMTNASEGAHMAHPDFRVNGRIFATLHPDDRSAMVKLTPDQQQRFVNESPESFQPEKGAWGLQGCTAVRLASVEEEVLGEALTLAWRNCRDKSSSRQPTRRRPRQSKKG